MIVTNVNGNVQNGDYIVSSDIAGYGQKQDDDMNGDKKIFSDFLRIISDKTTM